MMARGPLPEPAENIKGDIYLHDLGEISDAQLIQSLKIRNLERYS